MDIWKDNCKERTFEKIETEKEIYVLGVGWKKIKRETSCTIFKKRRQKRRRITNVYYSYAQYKINAEKETERKQLVPKSQSSSERTEGILC